MNVMFMDPCIIIQIL